MKFFRKILNSLFIFLLAFSCVTPVSAKIDNPKTLGDLRANYNELLQEKERNDNLTEEAKAEFARKEAAIKQAEADIHQAEADMEQAEEDIRVSNERIEEMKVNASDVLLYLQQMKGTNAYVEYVSGATSMTDMIMRIAAVEQLSDKIYNTIDELEAEIKRNEELKKELEQKKKDLEAQAAEYQRVIEANYEKIDEYDKYALDIDTQVQAAKEQLDMYVNKCSANIGRTDDAVVLTECSNVPLNSGWLNPLDHGVITSTIGWRWGSYHNALDIGGASPFEGTPVYAAAAGVVSGMIHEYSCGGNMLYINVNVNGEEYTTYYYHLLDFNVSMGDVVTQDTVIGWVGGWSTSTEHGGYDNCTTGSHLHYGVAKGYYNPYTGIIRSNVITPPGFPNSKGYSFYSRNQMWHG